MIQCMSPGDRITQPPPRGIYIYPQHGFPSTGKLFSILHLLSTLVVLRKYCTTYSMQGLFSPAPPLSPLNGETLEVHLQHCTVLYQTTPETLQHTVLRYTCNTALYCTEAHLQHYTVLWCKTALYCTRVHLQHRTVLYWGGLHSTVQYCTVLYCGTQ